ncbi:enoyl-CoA hydratase/isomerase family protein [Rhodococcus spongiicola]|uniref:3-hydroxyisobutyryl-CoA hydrolase n=1 Tax=Rhodococcus spongiicola TaxID=2487352 RepID=A0A3S3AAV6_9NOCA|nr:enoyl-CoA hydratase/isomerase family protein [Rhodococcus spongiicola]RVW05951.1 enoyl-CoA hydratase/isomerase family protein [Rhodococcus spongiicola]
MSTASGDDRRAAAGTASNQAEVIVERVGGLGRITLNRPKAINALTHTMVQALTSTLLEWAADDWVHAVLVIGAGERGLCAGGDIVSIYHDAREGGSGSKDFWRDEYVLNAAIARSGKPYVAIMDGIVMGGGVGISAHGNVRVVTERSTIAMPEVGIGFVPDVGGTYLLSRAPGELGTHIALTTSRLGAGDAIYCGFADHFVPSGRLAEFERVLSTGSVEDALALFAEPPPASELAEQRGWIDAAYAADTVEEIVANLRASGVPEATAAAEQILAKSPTAVKVTLRALRQAREFGSLEEALDQEYRVSSACLDSHDLVEGIRAQVVEKDRKPAWSPSTLEAVTDEHVDRFFEPLGESELGLAAALANGEEKQ